MQTKKHPNLHVYAILTKSVSVLAINGRVIKIAFVIGVTYVVCGFERIYTRKQVHDRLALFH